MDSISKALVFDGMVKVVAFKTTDIVNEGISLHSLAPLTAVALGKVLTVGAYMSGELKGAKEKLSITISNKGIVGNIVVACDAGGYVRGYIEHPDATLPALGNGKQNTMEGIGTDGCISVIKDLGLKECYTGKSELVNGSIDEDFAWYFTSSEGQPTAIALDVVIGSEGRCEVAGGIIVQPMPGCPDHILTVLEDIVTNFVNLGELLKEKSSDDFLKDYFGHFDIQYFEPTHPEYRCKCSVENMENVVRSIGRNDCVNLLMERGSIEIQCHFCGRKYNFSKEDVIDIWRRYDNKL